MELLIGVEEGLKRNICMQCEFHGTGGWAFIEALAFITAFTVITFCIIPVLLFLFTGPGMTW